MEALASNELIRSSERRMEQTVLALGQIKANRISSERKEHEFAESTCGKCSVMKWCRW